MNIDASPDDMRSLKGSARYKLRDSPEALRTIRPIGGNRVSVYVEVPGKGAPLDEFMAYLAALSSDLENVRVEWHNATMGWGDIDEQSYLSLCGEREAHASDVEIVRAAHAREMRDARWIENDARERADRLASIDFDTPAPTTSNGEGAK